MIDVPAEPVIAAMQRIVSNLARDTAVAQARADVAEIEVTRLRSELEQLRAQQLDAARDNCLRD